MRSENMTRLRDWALLLLCDLIWGSQFAMVKLVLDQMGPLFAVTFPFLLSTLLLMVVVARKGGSLRLPRRDLGPFLLLGIGGQFAAQFCITWGVDLSSASNAAILSLALPISTAFMAFLILRERMTPMRWASFALALAGFLMCSWGDIKGARLGGLRAVFGTLLIFISVSGSAFYTVYGKKLLERYSPLETLLYSYYTALGVMLLFTVGFEPRGFANLLHYSVAVWIGLTILALLQYFLSMVLMMAVLTRLDATQVGICYYLIPFFGVVIAWLIFHERLSWYMIGGGMLALLSTALVTVLDAANTQNSAVSCDVAKERNANEIRPG